MASHHVGNSAHAPSSDNANDHNATADSNTIISPYDYLNTSQIEFQKRLGLPMNLDPRCARLIATSAVDLARIDPLAIRLFRVCARPGSVMLEKPHMNRVGVIPCPDENDRHSIGMRKTTLGLPSIKKMQRQLNHVDNPSLTPDATDAPVPDAENTNTNNASLADNISGHDLPNDTNDTHAEPQKPTERSKTDKTRPVLKREHSGLSARSSDTHVAKLDIASAPKKQKPVESQSSKKPNHEDRHRRLKKRSEDAGAIDKTQRRSKVSRMENVPRHDSERRTHGVNLETSSSSLPNKVSRHRDTSDTSDTSTHKHTHEKRHAKPHDHEHARVSHRHRMRTLDHRAHYRHAATSDQPAIPRHHARMEVEPTIESSMSTSQIQHTFLQRHDQDNTQSHRPRVSSQVDGYTPGAARSAYDVALSTRHTTALAHEYAKTNSPPSMAGYDALCRDYAQPTRQSSTNTLGVSAMLAVPSASLSSRVDDIQHDPMVASPRAHPIPNLDPSPNIPVLTYTSWYAFYKDDISPLVLDCVTQCRDYMKSVAHGWLKPVQTTDTVVADEHVSKNDARSSADACDATDTDVFFEDTLLPVVRDPPSLHSNHAARPALSFVQEKRNDGRTPDQNVPYGQNATQSFAIPGMMRYGVARAPHTRPLSRDPDELGHALEEPLDVSESHETQPDATLPLNGDGLKNNAGASRDQVMVTDTSEYDDDNDDAMSHMEYVDEQLESSSQSATLHTQPNVMRTLASSDDFGRSSLYDRGHVMDHTSSRASRLFPNVGTQSVASHYAVNRMHRGYDDDDDDDIHSSRRTESRTFHAAHDMSPPLDQDDDVKIDSAESQHGMTDAMAQPQHSSDPVLQDPSSSVIDMDDEAPAVRDSIAQALEKQRVEAIALYRKRVKDNRSILGNENQIPTITDTESYDTTMQLLGQLELRIEEESWVQSMLSSTNDYCRHLMMGAAAFKIKIPLDTENGPTFSERVQSVTKKPEVVRALRSIFHGIVKPERLRRAAKPSNGWLAGSSSTSSPVRTIVSEVASTLALPFVESATSLDMTHLASRQYREFAMHAYQHFTKQSTPSESNTDSSAAPTKTHDNVRTTLLPHHDTMEPTRKMARSVFDEIYQRKSSANMALLRHPEIYDEVIRSMDAEVETMERKQLAQWRQGILNKIQAKLAPAHATPDTTTTPHAATSQTMRTPIDPNTAYHVRGNTAPTITSATDLLGGNSTLLHSPTMHHGEDTSAYSKSTHHTENHDPDNNVHDVDDDDEDDDDVEHMLAMELDLDGI